MNLQTIDGVPLTRENFKEYLRDVTAIAAEKPNFNYPEFLYDIRIKCEMTFEEFAGIIHEMFSENLERKNPFH